MVAPYIDDGTQLMQLKPSSILAAAEEDVVRFRRNTIPRLGIVRPMAFTACTCAGCCASFHLQWGRTLSGSHSPLGACRESHKRMTREIYQWERAQVI